MRIIAAVLDLWERSTLNENPNQHNLCTLKLLELLQRIDSSDPNEYVLLDRLHLDTSHDRLITVTHEPWCCDMHAY